MFKLKWSDPKRGQVWELAPGQFVAINPDRARRIASLDCPADFKPRVVFGPDAKPADQAEFLRGRSLIAAIGGAA